MRAAETVTGPWTLGVTGVIVEDMIHTADGGTTRDLGGIQYALATLSALLPMTASIQPILAVGQDAFRPVRRALEALPSIAVDGLVNSAAVNNKVSLQYAADGSREETLTGGVAPLPWETLEPWIERLDAWLWNFISGMETTQETFARLKGAFGGPVYMDLHNLCLEHILGRPRRRRPPPRWESWVEGVTWLQLNAEEAGLLGRGRTAPLPADQEAALAARIHGLGPRGVLVTRGPGGATWYGPGGKTAVEPAVHAGRAVDPTGCGDVFGAAWVALHLGRGLPAEEALAGAAAAAGVAATLRGTRDLRGALAMVEAGGHGG